VLLDELLPPPGVLHTEQTIRSRHRYHQASLAFLEFAGQVAENGEQLLQRGMILPRTAPLSLHVKMDRQRL